SDGKRLASTSIDTQLIIYTPENISDVVQVKGAHQLNRVTCSKWLDNQTLLTGGNDCCLKNGILQQMGHNNRFPDDETESALFGPFSWILGFQSNSRAQRLAKLGWKPHRPNMLHSIEEQVDAALLDAKN
ncbi:unnamed protein product, partial [Didymodactylos carnosus]